MALSRPLTPCITKEQKQFTFMSMAMNDQMNEILRDLLEIEIPSNSIDQRVKMFKTPLNLNQKQQNIIANAATKGYEEFDITLLCFLLRNICTQIVKPTEGWGNNMPEPGHKTTGDDIQRIRLIRNEVYGHTPSASMSDSDFNSYWNILSGICHRMEKITGKSYVREFNGIKSRIPDIPEMQKYQENMQNSKDDEEREKQISEGYDIIVAEIVAKEYERRIILLGKVGAGKSASGNFLLRKNIFESEESWSSITRECKYGTTIRNGLRYRIFDTPGAGAPEDEEVFRDDIKRCLYVTSPGFHCIALVIASNERITKEDQKMLNSLNELLGENACKYMIIIFTKTKNESKLEAQIRKSKEINELTLDCHDRWVCFGNDPDNISQTALNKFDSMLTELITKNARKEKACYEHQLYKKAYSILIKDMEDFMNKNKGYTEEKAFEVVRQKAFEGLSPRDDELLKLTNERCCTIL